MRIGAVNYLNSKPLVHELDQLAPHARVSFDLPSRLADSLAAGRLDVALVPSVEWLRQPTAPIVSDACVACCGPVLSVKLYFRTPPGAVRRVALDEGSRTSAALALILLDELAGAMPECAPLAIGAGLGDTDADAVLLIGDRAIQAAAPGCNEAWDLGERWYEWTGLPFVFALWVARANADMTELSATLSAARDRGTAHLAEIAAAEAPALGISTELATRYLRDYLHFTLGDEELRGLRRFAELCGERGFAPRHAVRALDKLFVYGGTQ